jgi:2,4-dienoyl-CoA reductase-like NADH-dependent reductase (Old Yellow Enzyme family)
MPKLKVAEPKEIGKILVKNRFVRSATFERMATEDGKVTEDLLEFYKTLAKGGVGLIITGITSVHPSGHGYPNQLAIESDDSIPSLNKLSDYIHKNGEGCKTVLQLGHNGRQSMTIGLEPIAPSAIEEPLNNLMPREMTVEEIEEITEAFAEATRRAMEAGFDGVQLHAAHGYLLSEFLSPHTNRRTDDYGGTTEKRVKIIEEIYKKALKKVGNDYPIMIKMNGDDFLEGGIDINESKKIATFFSQLGMAAIEVSGGMWEVVLKTKEELGWMPAMLPESRVDIFSKDQEAYNLPYAKVFKKLIKVPLILVGGLKSLDVIEKILQEEDADFIALCRPLIREPDLPNRWLKGIGDLTCDCISCNSCIGSIIQGKLKCIYKE